MPGWVQQGYDEYAKRLPRECELVLKEIAPGKRGKNSDVARIVKEEGERMLAAIPQGAHIVTLDIPGKPWTTPELAQAMKRWLESGQNYRLAGRRAGRSGRCGQANGARESWSLVKADISSSFGADYRGRTDLSRLEHSSQSSLSSLMTVQIILASASPRRKELLDQIKVTYAVYPVDT